MEHSLQIISERIPAPAEQTAASPVALSLLRVAYDYTHNREVLFIRATSISTLVAPTMPATAWAWQTAPASAPFRWLPVRDLARICRW